MNEAGNLKRRITELERSLAECRRVAAHQATGYAATRVLAESATLGEATPRIIQAIDAVRANRRKYATSRPPKLAKSVKCGFSGE